MYVYIHEKFEILIYPNQDELLNNRSERHVNRYLLIIYKANDWHSVQYLSHNSLIQLLTDSGNKVTISSVKFCVTSIFT